MGGDASGWRLSRREAKRLSVLREALEQGTGLGEVAYRHGADVAWDVGLMRAASAGGVVPDDAGIARAAAAEMPIRAADLADVLSGKALGEALKRAERAWIDSEFQMEQEALIEAALASDE